MDNINYYAVGTTYMQAAVFDNFDQKSLFKMQIHYFMKVNLSEIV